MEWPNTLKNTMTNEIKHCVLLSVAVTSVAKLCFPLAKCDVLLLSLLLNGYNGVYDIYALELISDTMKWTNEVYQPQRAYIYIYMCIETATCAQIQPHRHADNAAMVHVDEWWILNQCNHKNSRRHAAHVHALITALWIGLQSHIQWHTWQMIVLVFVYVCIYGNQWDP